MPDQPNKLTIPLTYENGRQRFSLADPEPDTLTRLRDLAMPPEFARIALDLTEEQIRFLAHCAGEANMPRLANRLHALTGPHMKLTGRRWAQWQRARRSALDTEE